MSAVEFACRTFTTPSTDHILALGLAFPPGPADSTPKEALKKAAMK
jgi:hypothetical protein